MVIQKGGDIKNILVDDAKIIWRYHDSKHTPQREYGFV